MKRCLTLLAIIILPGVLSACSESDARAWTYALGTFNAQYGQQTSTTYGTGYSYTPPPTGPVATCGNGTAPCLASPR